MKSYYILVLLFSFILSACDSSSTKMAESSYIAQDSSSQRESNPYLAYEHSINITSTTESIEQDFKKAIAACITDKTNKCTLLESNLSSGSYASANIRLRIAPEGTTPLLSPIANLGEVSSQSTRTEDLSIAIADSEKRIAMLTNYQNQIIELQKQKNTDIKSAMEIAKEIAHIQTQLEETEGASQYLKTRVKMDIINIHFSTEYRDAFWPQIKDSLSEFGSELSESTAEVITATAYLIPWIILLYLMFLLVRFIWKRRK